MIAIAHKALNTLYNSNILQIERENIEKDLEFLGLIIMENRLKPETTRTIKLLKHANIRCIMCTGDNILTGLNIISIY